MHAHMCTCTCTRTLYRYVYMYMYMYISVRESAEDTVSQCVWPTVWVCLTCRKSRRWFLATVMSSRQASPRQHRAMSRT